MKIDSHQHFWNYTAHAEDYVWMSDEYGALRRDFLPALQEASRAIAMAIDRR